MMNSVLYSMLCVCLGCCVMLSRFSIALLPWLWRVLGSRLYIVYVMLRFVVMLMLAHAQNEWVNASYLMYLRAQHNIVQSNIVDKTHTDNNASNSLTTTTPSCHVYVFVLVCLCIATYLYNPSAINTMIN